MKRIRILFCAVLIMGLIFTTPQNFALAASEITIDDDEYNLYVDEYPYDINEGIYAKFRTSKSNYDDYYLNLSSDESDDVFTAALDRSNINYTSDDKLFCSMTAALYRIDDEEDRKVTDTIILLLPVPDDAQEHPEDAVLYMVSSGSARKVDSTLVVCDDIYYNQFTLSSYTTYGYVYNDPYSYEEDDEGDDVEEEEEAPTPAPTKVPATPTPKPASTPNAGNSGSASVPVKDNIPKTGDDFSYTPLIAGGAVSALVLAYCLRKLTRK